MHVRSCPLVLEVILSTYYMTIHEEKIVILHSHSEN